jgi:hypothetical protein
MAVGIRTRGRSLFIGTTWRLGEAKISSTDSRHKQQGHRAIAAKGVRVKATSCSEAACPRTKQAHANRRRQGATVKVKGGSQGERDRRGWAAVA